MENRIKKLLLRLGIDPFMLGYKYLIDAIDICYCDSCYAKGVTKLLYPYLAKKNKTTQQRAERNIRNAIEKAFSCYSSEIEKELIIPAPSKSGKYTNSQFIAACVEKLKMEDNDA